MRVDIYREFINRDAAEAFVAQQLREFSPMAYDTTLTIHEEDLSGPMFAKVYTVQGHRYSSAD